MASNPNSGTGVRRCAQTDAEDLTLSKSSHYWDFCVLTNRYRYVFPCITIRHSKRKAEALTPAFPRNQSNVIAAHLLDHCLASEETLQQYIIICQELVNIIP